MSRTSAVVTAKWLAGRLLHGSTNQPLRVLDGSWHMPYTNRCARHEFFKEHIPSAQFFDIDECADKSAEFEHTVPPMSQFEDYVSKLGICNDTHVVVYDNNDLYGLFSAQRVWWTFRYFRHPYISVLNGGLPEWKRLGYELVDQVESVNATSFKASGPNLKLIKSFKEMEENLNKYTCQFTVADARAAGRFMGTSPEPRAGVDSGHMTGAINIPFTNLFDSETRLLKTPDQLALVFQSHGIDLKTPVTASCGSGVTACLIALAAHQCGKEDVSIYDGSWTEWFYKAKSQYKVIPQKA